MGATLTPLEMAHAMAHAKVGIIACGTTTWEAVCLSLPFVGLVTADNQVRVGRSLVENDIAQIIDCRSHIDLTTILEEIRQLLTKKPVVSKQRISSIDGGGALRSAEQIYSLIR